MGLENNGWRVDQVVDMVLEDILLAVGMVEEDNQLNEGPGTELVDKLQNSVDMKDTRGSLRMEQGMLRQEVDKELLKLVEGIEQTRKLEGTSMPTVPHMEQMERYSLEASVNWHLRSAVSVGLLLHICRF